MAFAAAGYQLEWSGKNQGEIGIDVATGRTLVRVNPKFYRPAEVELLIGCADKAKAKLGWEPQTTLEQLCQMMVGADIARNRNHETF
jgi:GDPmannose 4,6-dehydratase